MKKNLIVLFTFLSAYSGAYAQGTGNHLTLSLQDARLTKSNVIQFDLYAISDGSSSSDLRANSFQYGINFNTGILQAGSSISTSYVDGSSDLIPPLNEFSFPLSSSISHIRIVQGAYTKGNTDSTMKPGHPYRIGTFLLQSTKDFIDTASFNFSLQSSVATGKTVTAGVVWVGTVLSTASILVTGTGDMQKAVKVY